jgi:hypothetical protein
MRADRRLAVVVCLNPSQRKAPYPENPKKAKARGPIPVSERDSFWRAEFLFTMQFSNGPDPLKSVVER